MASSPRTFGPMLHFRGVSKDGKWTVRILTGADEGIETKIEVPGSSYTTQTVAFTLEGSATCPFVFNGLDVTVPQAAGKPTPVTYKSTIGGKTTEYTFIVPAKEQEPSTLYFSCNDIPLPQFRDKPENQDKYDAWKYVVQNFGPKSERPITFMIGGGDNIYADEIFFKIPDYDGGKDYGKCLDFYIHEYLRRFGYGDENMAFCLATIPTFMQCDDHDYYNGFGSFTEARRPAPEVSKAAQVSRFAFQLGLPTTVKIEGNNAIMENSTRAVRLGPKVVMLSLDMRSNRDVTKKTLMPLQLFKDKLKEVVALAKEVETTKHLIVLFASPVIWHHEIFPELYANVTKHVPIASIFATDALDNMRAFNNIEESTAILHELFTAAQANKFRLTFVSGDVHAAAYGTVRAEHCTDNDDFRYAQQWISSPICNVPDKTTGIDLIKKKLTGPQKEKFAFHADPVADKADKGKRGKLLAELDDGWEARNFLIIWTDDKNLNGQLYVNKEGTPLYEKIPQQWVAPPTGAPAKKKEDDGGCCSAM